MVKESRIDIDRLLDLVDIHPIVSHQHPVLEEDMVMKSFRGCLDAWQDTLKASGLGAITSNVKYTVVFSAFHNNYKSLIETDRRGQYIHLDNGFFLRPLNEKGQGLFFRAVSYKLEKS